MIREAIEAILNAFITPERRALRKAMRFWCADKGCITLKVRMN